MDVVETEDAAKGTGDLVPTPESSGTSTVGTDGKLAETVENPSLPMQVPTVEGQATEGIGEDAADDDATAMQQDEAVNEGDRAQASVRYRSKYCAVFMASLPDGVTTF